MAEDRNPKREPAPRQPDEEADEAREERQYTSSTPQRDYEQQALLDTEMEDDEGYPLGGQNEFDRVSTADNTDVVMDEMRDATDDTEILDDFEERQQMPTDEQGLFRRLREHHAETPQLSGGDLDAAWDQAQVGDETATVEPTPDQDLVDEIGGAMGVTYEDDEELGFAEKVYRRDEERWELNPASAEDAEPLDDEDEPAVNEDGGDDPFELDTTETETD
ncbi:MAG: DUF6335 family protein [Anaerolineae bacterium]|nr:DUF6335 family protein [Anaerolineae bacterium]